MTHDQNILCLMRIVHATVPRRNAAKQPAVSRLCVASLSSLEDAARADSLRLGETAKRLQDGLRRMRAADERALAAVRQHWLVNDRTMEAIRQSVKMNQKALDERVAITRTAFRPNYIGELARSAEQALELFNKRNESIAKQAQETLRQVEVVTVEQGRQLRGALNNIANGMATIRPSIVRT